MTEPAPSAPATSQSTPAQNAAAEVARAERALERALEDRIAAAAKRQAVEFAAARHVAACEQRVEVARILAMPELLALDALPAAARAALDQAAGNQARAQVPEGRPRAARDLAKARALARLAGVTL